MSRKKPLPPISGSWVRFNDVYRDAIARGGSSDLTIAKLQAALEEGRTRSKVEWLDREKHVRRELLSSAWWREHEIRRWNEGLAVFPRAQDARLNPTTVIFLWQPDLAQVFPSGEPVEPAHACSPVLASEGAPSDERAAKAQTAEDVRHKAIGAEIARRILAAHPTQPNSNKLAAEMLERWPEELGGKPGSSTLRRRVAAVIKVLRPLY
jgi:hypothetical protein